MGRAPGRRCGSSHGRSKDLGCVWLGAPRSSSSPRLHSATTLRAYLNDGIGKDVFTSIFRVYPPSNRAPDGMNNGMSGSFLVVKMHLGMCNNGGQGSISIHGHQALRGAVLVAMDSKSEPTLTKIGLFHQRSFSRCQHLHLRLGYSARC